MGIFSPYALASSFYGDDLATSLRNKKLLEAQKQGELQDEQKRRQAQALLGQILQGMGQGGVQGPNMIPQSPAPGQPSVPMRPQGAQSGPLPAVPQNNGAAPMPQPGGAPGGAAPQEPSAGQPRAVGGPPAQPAAGAAPGAGTMPFSWQAVAEEVRKRTDADPATIFAAMQEVMPQLEKENTRDFQKTQQEALLQQKREAQLNALNIQYSRATTEIEKAQINAAMKRITTEMNNNTALGVAGINADSRERVANTNATTKLDVTDRNNLAKAALADINNNSREKISANGLALKKELGELNADIAADKVAKSFLVQTRAQDLRERGMNQKDAQFYAHLEATQAIAAQRSEDTRRAQDLVHGDRVAAETGRNQRNTANLDAKTLLSRNKAAGSLDGTVSGLDQLAAAAVKLLEMPGLDAATGTVDSKLPTFQQDTADFETALDTLKAQVGFSVLQNMRTLSPTGGALGNVSNFEVKALQNSLASLDLRQGGDRLRENLRDIIDKSSGSKARLLNAYERQYGNAGQPKAAGGSVPVTPPGSPAAGGIDTPKEVANEPDGTVFKMDGKQFKKQGAKSIPVS